MTLVLQKHCSTQVVTCWHTSTTLLSHPPYTGAHSVHLHTDAYSMRNTIKDANLADKLSAEEKEKIEKAVDKVVEWLDHNQVGDDQGAGNALLCMVVACWLEFGPRAARCSATLKHPLNIPVLGTAGRGGGDYAPADRAGGCVQPNHYQAVPGWRCAAGRGRRCPRLCGRWSGPHH